MLQFTDISRPGVFIKTLNDFTGKIFVALGRASVCDYPDSFEDGFGISCMIDPFSGREHIWKIKLAEKPKKQQLWERGLQYRL